MGLRDKVIKGKPQPQVKEVGVTPSKPKIDPNQLSIQEIEFLLKLVNETTFKGANVAFIWSIVSKLQNQINKFI